MRRIWAALLVAALLFGGCGKNDASAPAESAGAETTAAATVPPDGNPKDVTCLGSYTREGSASAVIATAGDESLTNAQLAVWYWAQVAQYRASGDAPDSAEPLDQQPCGVDDSVNSWQQYFLKRALNAWHSAAALNVRSREVPLPTEEAYQPNLDNYAEYMDGMPATRFLYGYNAYYIPNTMHQAYLDSLPETLGALAQQKGYGDAETLAQQAFGASLADVQTMAENFNRAYMYFTTLTYSVEAPEESEDDTGAYLVDFRHILLVPGEETPEDTMSAFQAKAKKRLSPLTKQEKYSESTFADLAHFYSEDSATAVDGGIYRRVAKGELPAELDTWCFDPERQPGDTTVITSDDGIHILYFSGRESVRQVEAEDAALQARQADLIAQARKDYPMEVTYSEIALPEAEGTVSAGELLYPDIAHERMPEVPLYLQQDYPGTMYGGYPIRTNGCGITSMAMLASYMADDELTPPIMCARYGNYSHRHGTDGMIFVKEPPVMGFYLVEQTYDPTVAWKALEEGHVVVSVQHPGYWTRAGHYIVLQEITENGLVRVRDSNIYNYNRIPAHVNDEHTWGSITSAGSGFWIYDYKVTRVPACARCGDPRQAGGQLTQDYYCRRCAAALMRRNAYLTACEC
ncbi:MAG: peptidylprolyl isomerase [Candidatus Faecousia sp.]|nr:peptidylprolyl isomerase [Candidatus Faecousia sp.]